MGRRRIIGLAGLVVLSAAVLAAVPAAAGELQTSIDLNYSYEQRHNGPDITETNKTNQKYEIKYTSFLTSEFELLSSVKLELENNWATRTADTSRIAPSLEVTAKGSQAEFKITYQSTKTATGAYQEAGDVSTYANDFTTEFLVTPQSWPEIKLKYERKRDYQLQSKDSTNRSMELQVRKDVSALRLELNLKRDQKDEVLPASTQSDNTEWSTKVTYKEVLYGGTEFELAYEIKEKYTETYKRGVFQSIDEDYLQDLKTRFKNSLVITPRLNVGLSWEYEYQQDLLMLSYDYKVNNKLALDLRYDILAWVKFSGGLKRDMSLVAGLPDEDREDKVADTADLTLDVEPLTWLRLTSKAGFKDERSIEKLSGATVDEVREEKYETVLRNKFGDFWDLTVNSTSSYQHANGWITSKEARFKANLRLKFFSDFTIEPTYDVGRTTDWEEYVAAFQSQKQSAEWKVKFDYKHGFFDLLMLTFSHEYGVKREDSLDEWRNFERAVDLNENTKLNLAVADLIQDLKVVGEIERNASDSEDDPDPMLVDVSYSLKLDWKVEILSVTTSLKFNDKGDTYNDVSFNAKVELKIDEFNVAGEYQFDKIYSDEIDETRKLNLKMSMKF